MTKTQEAHTNTRTFVGTPEVHMISDRHRQVGVVWCLQHQQEGVVGDGFPPHQSALHILNLKMKAIY